MDGNSISFGLASLTFRFQPSLFGGQRRAGFSAFFRGNDRMANQVDQAFQRIVTIAMSRAILAGFDNEFALIGHAQRPGEFD